MTYVWLYVTTAVVLLVLDASWLTATKSFYRSHIGHLLAPQMSAVPGILFYVLYVVGIVIFVSKPAFDLGSWTTGLAFGALFGFFCYATYNFTNMATLRDWPVSLSAADLSWGTAMTAISAAAGVAITRWIVGL